MELSSSTAVADDDFNEEVRFLGDEVPSDLMKQLVTFSDTVKASRAFQGTFTFLLCALVFRVRIRVWHNQEVEDILNKYCAWASPDLFTDIRFEVIACYRDGEGRLQVPDDARNVNHFVACVRFDNADLDSHGPLDAEDEGTSKFKALYLSHRRVVIPTIADGDCGPDTMCVLLHMNRTLHNRNTLREELAAFLLKHSHNRALIYSMWSLLELQRHIGEYELETADAYLFEATGERHGHDVPPRDAHHEDGNRLSCSEVALRPFTSVQINAIRVICRLEKATDEHVLGVLKLLPSDCVDTYVRQYEERQVERRLTPKKRKKFITRRDMHIHHKDEAVEEFLQWVQKKFPTISLTRFKNGRWPKYC